MSTFGFESIAALAVGLAAAPERMTWRMYPHNHPKNCRIFNIDDRVPLPAVAKLTALTADYSQTTRGYIVLALGWA